MMNVFMVFAAKYLYLFIVLVTILFLSKEKARRKSILIFSAVILPIVYVIAQIAGKIYYSPRPFVVEHFTPLISHAVNNGFPSDHSLISFTLASLIFIFNRKLGLVLFALAFFVGLSRVYVGVHWPVDILGSFAIAVGVSAVCAKIISWKK